MSDWHSSPTRLLKVDDAAHYLSLSRSRIYELMATHDLESVAIGRSRRIPLRALEEFVTRLSDPEENQPG